MQLNAVVLPEPLGPMSPRISPTCTSNDTAFSAVKPPKRFVSSRTFSTGAAARAAAGAARRRRGGGAPRWRQRIASGEDAGSGRIGAAVAAVLG